MADLVAFSKLQLQRICSRIAKRSDKCLNRSRKTTAANMMMRMGDNMAMDMDSGELHMVDGWDDDDNNNGFCSSWGDDDDW